MISNWPGPLLKVLCRIAQAGDSDVPEGVELPVYERRAKSTFCAVGIEMPRAGTADGAVPVQENEWMDLEDGVQVLQPTDLADYQPGITS
jgi:hypothetical protein